ncbi:MAG: ABC transporter permease subunit [Methylobacteriaceae bacterium]|nr:ABC transporter permease subunit [Methylobacteriaceae bacterium]MBV9703722.1 ABC transporter permease subunit [Methylobacteriaceae bacterium]
MLVWSKSGRALVWTFAGLLIGIVYAAPLAIIAMASLAGEWNGVLPTKPTLEHYASALSGASGEQLQASLITGAVASLVALGLGTWAALALRAMAPLPRRILDVIFFIPSAVPSVSVGLGLLVAFSRPPLLLNGTTTIVFIAHFVLISAFTYGNLSAGLARLLPDYEQVAESLGARAFYRLTRVTLPLVLPYMLAALSLSFAMSMGELGATIMVYPPGWVTMPVGIFALTDRGDVFEGSALTMLLIASTLAMLLILSRIPTKAAPR